MNTRLTESSYMQEEFFKKIQIGNIKGRDKGRRGGGVSGVGIVGLVLGVLFLK